MNAVSRFDAVRQKRGQERLRQVALIAACVAGGLLFFALAFQLFFRYEYLTAGGVTWRIDRVTQETCQIAIGQAKCVQTSPSTTVSTSTSTSTSLSTSTSVKVKVPPKHPH